MTAIDILRAALHAAKRGCTCACTDRKVMTKDWAACICGALEHNAAIDTALKQAKEAEKTST